MTDISRAVATISCADCYRALQNQVRELQRLLGKKTMEAEILKNALELAVGSKKTDVAVAVVAEGWFAMKAVCETLGVARSNIAERSKGRGSGRRGRPPEPDGELVAGIEEVIKGLPTYGYCPIRR